MLYDKLVCQVLMDLFILQRVCGRCKANEMKGAAGTVSQAIATPKIRPLVYLTFQAYRYAINFVSHSKTYNSHQQQVQEVNHYLGSYFTILELKWLFYIPKTILTGQRRYRASIWYQVYLSTIYGSHFMVKYVSENHQKCPSGVGQNLKIGLNFVTFSTNIFKMAHFSTLKHI